VEPEPEPKKRSKRATIEEPSSVPPPPKVEKRPARKALGKLFATTNSGDSWEISDAETFLGRSKQCSIVLKSQRVSRKHASVTKEDDGYYINDLGAANGIWAGTEKIDREKIADGAEYIIGDVLVSFSLG
jgi:predicted component of type VI protein secretion system